MASIKGLLEPDDDKQRRRCNSPGLGDLRIDDDGDMTNSDGEVIAESMVG